jgi:hypothetical protein
MDIQFYFDVDRLCLVNGINDPSTPEKVTFVQGDTANITINGVTKVPVSLTDAVDTLDYYRYAEIPFTVIKLAIGLIDAPPTGGTFKINVVGGGPTATTTALAYSATKYQIQTALNALTYVSDLGGVKVVGANATASLETGAPNIHEIIWNDGTDVSEEFAFSEPLLTPFCLRAVRTEANSVLGTITILKFWQAPIAYSQNFVLPVPPVPVIATVRSGTGSANAVQSYSFKTNSQSRCSLTYSGRSTPIFPVTSEASVIQAALNGLYSDGLARFSVTQQRKGYYYIEFVGDLGNAAQSDLTVTMAENVPLITPRGTLDLSGLGLEIALAGEPSVTMTMELEITNGSNVSTPIQIPAIVKNDMIDAATVVYNDPDWVETITNPTSAIEYDGSEVYVGVITYITGVGVGDSVSRTFSITHNLATLNVQVQVRESGGTNAILEDSEYETVIVDANHISVTFATPPELNQYVVMIVAVGSNGEHWVTHTHTSDQVFHDGVALSTILDNLSMLESPLDLWPTIPLDKVPDLSWDKLRGTGVAGSDTGPVIPDDMLPTKVAILDAAGHLGTSTLPAGVLQLDPATGVIVYGTVDGSATTIHNFFDTTTNQFSSTVIEGVVTQISQSTVIYQAILSALQAGGSLPNGTTILEIPDFQVTVPPIQTIKGPSTKVKVLSNVVTENQSAVVSGSTITTTTATPVTETLDVATTVEVYDYLSPAIVDYVDGGVVSTLPASPIGNTVYTLSADVEVRTSGSRRGRKFKSYSRIAYNNSHWYEVILDGSLAYPKEMEQEAFRLIVTSNMLPVSRIMGVNFTFQTKLAGNALGRGDIILEVAPINPDQGTSKSLGGLTWATLLTKPVVLTKGNVLHPVTFTLQRAANGTITAKTSIYGTETTLGAGTPLTTVTNLNFALRCRFHGFDCEDFNDPPKGALTLAVKGGRASIVPLS